MSLEEAIDNLKNLDIQGKMDEFEVEIDQMLEERIEDSFNGIENETVANLSSGLYKQMPEIALVALLESDHSVSAYLTLNAFIDEKVSEILLLSLEDHENASNGEVGSIVSGINTPEKINLLKVNGVIDKDLRDALNDFRAGYRNNLTHNASEHILTGEESDDLRRKFKRGVESFKKLRRVEAELVESD